MGDEVKVYDSLSFPFRDGHSGAESPLSAALVLLQPQPRGSRPRCIEVLSHPEKNCRSFPTIIQPKSHPSFLKTSFAYSALSFGTNK